MPTRMVSSKREPQGVSNAGPVQANSIALLPPPSLNFSEL